MNYLSSTEGFEVADEYSFPKYSNSSCSLETRIYGSKSKIW